MNIQMRDKQIAEKEVEFEFFVVSEEEFESFGDFLLVCDFGLTDSDPFVLVEFHGGLECVEVLFIGRLAGELDDEEHVGFVVEKRIDFFVFFRHGEFAELEDLGDFGGVREVLYVDASAFLIDGAFVEGERPDSGVSKFDRPIGCSKLDSGVLGLYGVLSW